MNSFLFLLSALALYLIRRDYSAINSSRAVRGNNVVTLGDADDDVDDCTNTSVKGDSSSTDWMRAAKLVEKMARDENAYNVELRADGIHDIKFAHRDIRPELDFTWQDVSDSIKKGSGGKEQYCSLYRDNWSCVGAQYESYLSQAQPYDPSLTLGALKRDSMVLFEGNSLMGQVGTTIICNTPNVVVWNLEVNRAPIHDEYQNSVFVYVPQHNVTMMLWSNNISQLNTCKEESAAMLKEYGFIPDHIVTGVLNKNKDIDDCDKVVAVVRKGRENALSYFPEVKLYKEIFNLYTYVSNNECCGDGGNCCVFSECTGKAGEGYGCHSCLPGPINAVAENLVKLMISSEQSPARVYDDTYNVFDKACAIPSA